LFSPEQGRDVKYGADEDDEHRKEEEYEEDRKTPRVTGSDVTHALYRDTAYVTRVRAHVTDTRAVAVALHRYNHRVTTCHRS